MAKTEKTDRVLREIGRRIRAARAATGMSQEAAAARAEIDYKRWQRLEQGTVNATIRTVNRVAKALEVSIWDLFAAKSKAAKIRRRKKRNH